MSWSNVHKSSFLPHRINENKNKQVTNARTELNKTKPKTKLRGTTLGGG